MKVLLPLLLIAATTSAEPKRVPFTLPRRLPVSVSIVLPDVDSVLSHKKTATGDRIAAKLTDIETEGLVVEISDSAGRVVWRHDFGFNSSQESNSIEVACHPTLPLILVEYSGYKWDHDHKLLFIEHVTPHQVVREYTGAKADILPILRRQKGFEADYEYWIYPSGFVPQGVTFECIPLEKPERQAVHPFAQDPQWFRVTATVSDAFKISPTSVTSTH